MSLENVLLEPLEKYRSSFSGKVYVDSLNEVDVLMNIFGISQELKKENKQYWGRELGMCWQILLSELFSKTNKEFSPAVKFGDDEPADFFIGKDAIDTKYRVGSGDSGTLKKFKQYGRLLKDEGFNPIFLFLRTDNLPAAITACNSGGWTVLTGDDSFEYIKDNSGFDLKDWLIKLEEAGKLLINR